MSDWRPRHRRRRPGAVVLYVVLGAAVLVAVGALWSVNMLFGRDPEGNDRTETPPGDEPVEQSATPGQPVGEAQGRYDVGIPEIGVLAPVVDVVSDGDRVLAPPEDPLVAGWWSDGAAPGDPNGTALIVGHAVESGAAVFNDMGELAEGDTISLTGETDAVYEVSTVQVLAPDELAERAEELFAQDGQARLVLVTCEGWDGEQFGANIVVTAHPT